jgi:hypothetical protein
VDYVTNGTRIAASPDQLDAFVALPIIERATPEFFRD